MAQFIYEAKEGPDKSVHGVLEADTLESAVSRIIGLGYAPVLVHPATAKDTSVPRKAVPANYPKRVSFADRTFFIRQLSDLVRAGVPVMKALTLTGRQTRNPYLQEIIATMGDHVSDGGTLSQAMGRFPDVFPRVYGHLVRAGENGGKLAEVLNRLADLAQRDLETRNQVILSLIYPALIMVVGSGTVFVLLTWVVPKLTEIFADMNEALPLPTVILMAVSGFLARFWPLILLSIGAGIYYFYRMAATTEGRLRIDDLKLRIPIAGDLFRSVEVGRFSRTMATLLGNGVSIIPALESTALVMGNEVMRRDVEAMVQNVANGASLNGAMKRSQVFPEVVVTMIAVGEETGQVHQSLEQMADYFERKAQEYMKAMTTLMEPVLILGLGLVVSFVVVAMLMPLLKMNMMIQ